MVVDRDWQRRGLLPRDVGVARYTDVAEGIRSRQGARYVDTAATSALFARSQRLGTSTSADLYMAGPYIGSLSSLATRWDVKHVQTFCVAVYGQGENKVAHLQYQALTPHAVKMSRVQTSPFSTRIDEQPQTTTKQSGSAQSLTHRTSLHARRRIWQLEPAST